MAFLRIRGVIVATALSRRAFPFLVIALGLSRFGGGCLLLLFPPSRLSLLLGLRLFDGCSRGDVAEGQLVRHEGRDLVRLERTHSDTVVAVVESNALAQRAAVGAFEVALASFDPSGFSVGVKVLDAPLLAIRRRHSVKANLASALEALSWAL